MLQRIAPLLAQARIPLGRALLFVGGLGKALRVVPMAVGVQDAAPALVWSIAGAGLAWGVAEVWCAVQSGPGRPRAPLARRVGAALLLPQGALLVIVGLYFVSLATQGLPSQRAFYAYGAAYSVFAVLMIWAALGLWPARSLTHPDDDLLA